MSTGSPRHLILRTTSVLFMTLYILFHILASITTKVKLISTRFYFDQIMCGIITAWSQSCSLSAFESCLTFSNSSWIVFFTEDLFSTMSTLILLGPDTLVVVIFLSLTLCQSTDSNMHFKSVTHLLMMFKPHPLLSYVTICSHAFTSTYNFNCTSIKILKG